jgi:hypothetical protein
MFAYEHKRDKIEILKIDKNIDYQIFIIRIHKLGPKY